MAYAEGCRLAETLIVLKGLSHSEEEVVVRRRAAVPQRVVGWNCSGSVKAEKRSGWMALSLTAGIQTQW